MDGLNRLEFLTCRNGAFLFCTVVSPSDVHTMGLLIHILHTHKTHETLLPFAHSYLGCWWTSIYMALVFRRECKQKTKVSRMENEWNDCNEINLIFFASPYLLTSSHMTLNTGMKTEFHLLIFFFYWVMDAHNSLLVILYCSRAPCLQLLLILWTVQIMTWYLCIYHNCFFFFNNLLHVFFFFFTFPYSI